jgi:hypothetical protein
MIQESLPPIPMSKDQTGKQPKELLQMEPTHLNPLLQFSRTKSTLLLPPLNLEFGERLILSLLLLLLFIQLQFIQLPFTMHHSILQLLNI